MFFIPLKNWKTCFFIKVYHYPEVFFNRYIVVASCFEKVRIFQVISSKRLMTMFEDRAIVFLEALVRRCSVKKVFLEISQNLQENTWCQSLFFNTAAGLRPATLLKRRLWHSCFPMNFEKFLRTPLIIEHLRTTISENNFSFRLLLLTLFHFGTVLHFSLLMKFFKESTLLYRIKSIRGRTIKIS